MTTSQWFLVCWGTVIAVWVVGALYNAFFGPKVVEQDGPGRFVLVGVLVFIAAELLNRLLPRNFWDPITFHAPWLWTVGLIILIVSTVFVLWARWALGQLWSSTAMVKQDHQLRTGGPYRITRHPIYTGFLGMMIGTMLMNGIGAWLALVLVAIVGFELKIYAEESLLTRTFGEQYVEYKHRVPQLIPGLVLRRSN